MSQRDKFTGKDTGGNPLGITNGKASLTSLLPCNSQQHLKSNGVWRPQAYLVPAAARAFDAMANAAAAEGVILKFSGGYRDYATQVALRNAWCAVSPAGQYCSYAAVPGTSNHGYGMAVDMMFTPSGPKSWMDSNARHFGWGWPEWADYPGVYEPWHWQAFTNIATFPLPIIPSDEDPLADGALREGERDETLTQDANPFDIAKAKGTIARHQYALRVWLVLYRGWPHYAGAKPFAIDGVFGPRTKEVVGVFQAVNLMTPADLNLVGVIGPTTRARLIELTGVILP